MRRIVSLLLIFLVGCGPSHEAIKLFPVTGTLTVDGTPLANVAVDLFPIEGKTAGRPAGGVTDKNGQFKLACNGAPGAPKGTYRVVLSKVDTNNLTPEQLMSQSGPPKSSDASLPFPEEYSSPETSPGQVEISDHEVTLDLKL